MPRVILYGALRPNLAAASSFWSEISGPAVPITPSQSEAAIPLTWQSYFTSWDAHLVGHSFNSFHPKMYLTALRSASRPVVANLRSIAPRRFTSTATRQRPTRSWKSSAMRLSLAAGTLYYFNTSPVFAEAACMCWLCKLMEPSLTVG